MLAGLLVASHGPGCGGATDDTTGPTVVATQPPDGAEDVPLDTAVSVTFSEHMNAATLDTSTFTVVPQDGSNTPIGGTVSYVGSTATFTPASDLARSTLYVATISREATDEAGNGIADDHDWMFTTGPRDTERPAVTATVPEFGAFGVPVGMAPSATFSEPMDPASLHEASFTLQDAGGLAVAGTVSYADGIATFTPDEDLAFESAYTATVTSEATDLAGNPLFVETPWTFSTEASFTVAVSRAGNGQGTVTSSPAGISCGDSCSHAFGTSAEVLLMATPAGGSTFDGFTGTCASITPTCALAATGDQTVTAYFNPTVASEAGLQLGLDGVDDVAVHESSPNPPTSALDLTTFTIEAWIFPLADKEMLVVADSGYYLMIRPQPLRAEVAVLTTSGFPASQSFAGTIAPLEVGRWSHVVGMVNGATRTIRVAVNGELSDTRTMGNTIDVDFPQTFSIGNSFPESLGDHPFVGRIDEVRLSSVIRYDTAFAPAPLLVGDDTTVGLWHFDEAAGAGVLADSSGNANDLTGLNGAATIAGSRPVP